MGWRDRRYDDSEPDIDIGLGRRDGPPPGSSGWSLASFVIALLNGLFLFGLFFVAVLMNLDQNAPIDDNDPKMIVLGFAFLAGMAFAVLGVILGFVGVGQKSGTIFAVLGIVFNALILVSVVGLICAGMAMGP